MYISIHIFKVARRFLFCLIDSAAARCALIGETKEYLWPRGTVWEYTRYYYCARIVYRGIYPQYFGTVRPLILYIYNIIICVLVEVYCRHRRRRRRCYCLRIFRREIFDEKMKEKNATPFRSSRSSKRVIVVIVCAFFRINHGRPRALFANGGFVKTSLTSTSIHVIWHFLSLRSSPSVCPSQNPRRCIPKRITRVDE